MPHHDLTDWEAQRARQRRARAIVRAVDRAAVFALQVGAVAVLALALAKLLPGG